MSAKGFDVADSKVLNKSGQEIDEVYLQRYQCVFCNLILRDACQLLCGDRICRVCLPQTAFQCPSCQEDVDPTKPHQFFPDKSCQNDVKDFQVRCRCGWQGGLLEWEDHYQSCTEHSSGDSQVQSVEGTKLRSDVSELRIMVLTTQKKTDSLEKQVREVKALVDELRGGSGGRGVLGSGLLSTAGGDTTQLNKKYADLSDLVAQLVSDVEQHKGTITQMNTSVENLSQTVPRYNSILEELNLKIEILEVKSATGVYVWKVNELQRRAREARVGKTVSLYSPPFYTSTHGYRLCLRCYLYGDGVGKGTHISLFIVIMRSEYDDLLAWPFAHRVTLSLINQNHPLSPEKAITHKFIPNAESSSFQKPKDTFNIASGFPEFAALSILSNDSFVKNDTMFVRVKLDPPDTPTGPDSIMM